MIKALASLLTIGLICGMLLSVVEHQTAAPIAANQAMAARAMLQSILPELPAGIDVNAASLGDCEQWRVQRFTVPGYAGEIQIVGVWHANANALTLRVVEHRETPGIGDFIDVRRDPWIQQYDRSPLQIYANMDNVSGATVTTRAMRNAAQTLHTLIKQACDL